jgi:hypothetical protein
MKAGWLDYAELFIAWAKYRIHARSKFSSRKLASFRTLHNLLQAWLSTPLDSRGDTYLSVEMMMRHSDTSLSLWYLIQWIDGTYQKRVREQMEVEAREK